MTSLQLHFYEMDELLLGVYLTRGKERCAEVMCWVSGNFEKKRKIQDGSKVNYVKIFLVEYIPGQTS